MRRSAGYAGWIVAVLVLAFTAGGSARALEGDPSLQGRILQRSDGFLYVYKDGARYWVHPAPLNDDQINAIPEAGPAVDRVDQLYAPPPPPPPETPDGSY